MFSGTQPQHHHADGGVASPARATPATPALQVAAVPVLSAPSVFWLERCSLPGTLETDYSIAHGTERSLFPIALSRTVSTALHPGEGCRSWESAVGRCPSSQAGAGVVLRLICAISEHDPQALASRW